MATTTPAFRKGGRPRKDGTEKRGKWLRARVRPDELALVQERAASTNRIVSDYLRELALYGRIVVQQFHALSAIDRHDLARIGSNLNQIARACNATGETERAHNIEAHLAELRTVLDRIGGPSDELGQG